MGAAKATPSSESTSKTDPKEMTEELYLDSTIKEKVEHIDRLDIVVDRDFSVRYSELQRKKDFEEPFDKVLPLIFRLPIKPEVNGYFFTPRVVSIGPFHHGKSCLAKMERHKSRFLEDFLSRDTNRSLEHYQNELKKRLMKQSFKNDYYDVNGFDLTRDELVDIMILDGCFILEFLIKIYNDTLDEIFQNETLLRYIKTDLLMFENQLPLFVIEMLYENPVSTIEELLGYYFWGTKDDPSIYEKYLNPRSLLHYYNKFFIFPRSDDGKAKRVYPEGSCIDMFSADLRTEYNVFKQSIAPSARELEKVGVVFRAKKSANFLDITFHEGVLEIPILSLDEPFVLSFVNLHMFDLHVDRCSIMKSYCHLMACLMPTSNDVDILRKHGILQSKFITDQEWRDLLYSIGNPCECSLPYEHYFKNLLDDLFMFYMRPRKKHVLQRFFLYIKSKINLWESWKWFFAVVVVFLMYVLAATLVISLIFVIVLVCVRGY